MNNIAFAFGYETKSLLSYFAFWNSYMEDLLNDFVGTDFDGVSIEQKCWNVIHWCCRFTQSLTTHSSSGHFTMKFKRIQLCSISFKKCRFVPHSPPLSASRSPSISNSNLKWDFKWCTQRLISSLFLLYIVQSQSETLVHIFISFPFLCPFKTWKRP